MDIECSAGIHNFYSFECCLQMPLMFMHVLIPSIDRNIKRKGEGGEEHDGKFIYQMLWLCLFDADFKR